MNKLCRKCNTPKHINEFGVDKSHKDGHRSVCKKCIGTYMKEYIQTEGYKQKRKIRYQVNRKEMLQANKENRKRNGWRWNQTRKEKHKNNPLIMMCRQAKIRAKKKKLDFDLNPSDLVLPPVCPVLGIPLYVSESGNASNNSPTLDRINNLKGYTKDNVIIVSFRANTIKNFASIDELKKIYNFYKEKTNG
jgi:hypothetical protein